MRLWLSKNSDVPIREQLVTQLILGIVSNDLKVKQRLPSTRDLARRYDIHANTVSAAYRELARRGWVEFRKGSGVYVRAQTAETLESDFELEQLIARFIKSTRARGYSLTEIQAGVKRSLQVQPPDQFLLVEPDVELRAILVSEIAQSTGVTVTGAGRDELADSAPLFGAVPVVLFGHFEEVRNCIAPESDLLVINSASVAEAMRGQKRPPADALVAIVSRWPEFLRWSRTMLVAAGLDGDALSFRDARESGWEKGLRSASFVITDSLMAPRMPANCEVRVFRVIADTSLKELRDYAERFFGESCSNL
jgi:GntR family transcriptional regulator